MGKIFMWVLIVTLIFILAFLVIINREELKIQEALLTAIPALFFVVLGIIFLSNDTNSIKKEINQIYFISLTENQPAFFPVPILIQYFTPQSILLASKIEGAPRPKIFDFKEHKDDLVDFETMAILQHLSMFYSLRWNVQRISVILPTFDTIRGRAIFDEKKSDRVIYTYKDLEQKFGRNKYFYLLNSASQITLPKGTEIEYESYNKEKMVSRIRIFKPFYFDINLIISFPSYSAGLGYIASYIGLVKPTNKWLVNFDVNDKWGSGVVNIKATANFPALGAGNPYVIKYKEWTNNLFLDLYNTFDWSICDNKIKEYNSNLANLLIINNLPNNFSQ